LKVATPHQTHLLRLLYCCADSFAAWVGAVFGIVSALFTLLVIMPVFRTRINAAGDRATLRANKMADERATKCD